jgi:hypothetical protein
MGDEVTGNRLGSAFAIRQYGQLLLLEVLRAYVHQAELPPGWLRALNDEQVRPALTVVCHDVETVGGGDLSPTAWSASSGFSTVPSDRTRGEGGGPAF